MIKEITDCSGKTKTKIICDFCSREIKLELNRFAISLVNESLDFCDNECYGKFLDYEKAKQHAILKSKAR